MIIHDDFDYLGDLADGLASICDQVRGICGIESAELKDHIEKLSHDANTARRLLDTIRREDAA